MGIYTVAKFGTDWSIFADARVNKVNYGKLSNSMADNLDSCGLISSIIKLIRDLMVIYTLTKFDADFELVRNLMGIYTVAKFGTDWSIFADARV